MSIKTIGDFRRATERFSYDCEFTIETDHCDELTILAIGEIRQNGQTKGVRLLVANMAEGEE